MGGNQSSGAAATAPSLVSSGAPVAASGDLSGATGGAATPQLMRAWSVQAPSTNLSAISCEHKVAIPKPQPNEVLIKVVCAGVNPVDWKRASFPAGEFAYPCIIGVDCAGTIVEMGANVDPGLGLDVGAAVHAHLDLRRTYGSYAEYVACEASIVCKISPNVTFAEAAALPCAGWTAFVALFEKLKIETKKTILITGGSGGVGSFAIQLAKHMELTVIATCSTSNVDFVKSLGADLVVDYTTEDVFEKTLFFMKGEGVDYILDTVSAENALRVSHLLRFSGQVANVVGLLTPEPFFFERQLSIHHVFLGGHHRDEQSRAVLRRVGDTMMLMVSLGKVKVPALELIKFEQVPDALALSKNKHVRGKIVLSMVPKREAAKIKVGDLPHPVQGTDGAQQHQSATPDRTNRNPDGPSGKVPVTSPLHSA
jgi:NADPH2:quinone reductase